MQAFLDVILISGAEWERQSVSVQAGVQDVQAVAGRVLDYLALPMAVTTSGKDW